MATPPLFHAATERLRDDTVMLGGAEGRHAVRVRRIRPGERVLLADGAGLCVSCEVTAVDRDELRCVVLTREVVPRPEPWLVVVQALAKGHGAEQAVETMTEAGVDEIVPWQAERCVVRWRGERAEKALQRWRTTTVEAAKRSRRAWTPVLAGPATTADVVARLSSAALAVVLDADRGGPVGDLAVPDSGEIVVVVGPEGGLTESELDAFRDAGAGCTRLGPTVVRSATAGTVTAAALLSRTSRWRQP